jgi:hypothetical protein
VRKALGILLGLFLALAPGPLLAPGPILAQDKPAQAGLAPALGEKPLTARSAAHLYELISREPPLSKQEIQAYEEHLESIVALDADPSLMPEILERTGWTQERFTYVVTKVSVGLSNILYPENPRLINAPDFVNPTPAERELIVDRLKELVKGYQNLAKPKPVSKGNR